MLEYLLSPAQARKNPWALAFLSFAFVSIAVLTQLFIPTLEGSIIIFALIPAIPLFFLTLLSEEAQEEQQLAMRQHAKFDKNTPGSLLERFKLAFRVHKTLIELFAFMFVGAVFAYAFWFTFLPADQSARLFAAQLNEVKLISAAITGLAFSEGVFNFLFFHNLQVFVLMFAFSLVYGFGSLYLILWNASIIGVVLGSRVATEGVLGIFTGFLGLLPHGIFELSSYFVIALAGGVLSISLVHRKKPFFKRLLEDVLVLTFVALVLLFIGALIESSY